MDFVGFSSVKNRRDQHKKQEGLNDKSADVEKQSEGLRQKIQH